MENQPVLSPEEVDALLKVTQTKTPDLSNLLNEVTDESLDDAGIGTIKGCDQKSLKNITQLLWADYESTLSTFLRKKIIVKLKSISHQKFSNCIREDTQPYVYSVFKFEPSGLHCVGLVDLPLLHQSINILFGGKINEQEEVVKSPGKIGEIVAEKISELALDSFEIASKEIFALKHTTIKTVSLPILITKVGIDDYVDIIELTVSLAGRENTVMLMFEDGFLKKFIPEMTKEVAVVEKSYWRSAIETQVIDSIVTVKVCLPDIKLKMQDLMELKENALFPISDPTLVYVCLNDIKLFRANAGQSGANLVAKILNEI